MKVYKQEILDGLSEQIKTQASVAYCSPAVLSTNEHFKLSSNSIVEKIKAESANPKQIDLYYIKSVLVSTGWNKNDDVFSSEATWQARSTPEDKQFNFMHNENDIIGHITGSYVIDRNGNVISEDGEMPTDFDIITEAVLYNSWTNPDNRERMNNIIAEIEEGKWFVSMECLFAGFDYSLIDNNGMSKTIARSDESAFLTKHLRAYGGTGEYEGYKVGRVLRDISFSGKGLVSKPANPRSVILDASKAFSITELSSVSNINIGEKDMSDNTLDKQLADLREELNAAKEESIKITEAKDKEVADLQQSVSDFEQQAKSLTEAVAEKEKTIQDLNDALAAKDAELNDLKAAYMDMKKKEKMAMRKASLIDAGFEDAEADESLSLYDSLEDSAFESIVAAMKKKMAEMKMKKEEMKKEEMNSKSEITQAAEAEEVTEELFDGVKSTEATLVDASNDDDELNATRASVAQWLSDNVFSK